MVLIIKEMQFSYHVVIQHLFRPLKKEFVIFDNRSISLGQTFRQYTNIVSKVYLIIFPGHDMLIGPYTCYVHIENLCLLKKITLGICTPVARVLFLE
jgi:hypothetical protein